MFKLVAGDIAGWNALLLLLVAISSVLVVCALLWRHWHWICNLVKARRNGDVGKQVVPGVPHHDVQADYHSPPTLIVHEDHASHASKKHSGHLRASTHTRAPALDTSRHRETQRLLPSRAATQSYYSAAHPHHSHNIGRTRHDSSSRILPFEDTHDEPLPMDPNQEEIPAHTRGAHGSINYTLDPRPTGHGGRNTHGGSFHRAYTESEVVQEFRERLRANTLAFKGPAADYDADTSVPEGPGKRYREMARAEARLRKSAFENSKRAYQMGKKADAKRASPCLILLLSDEGKVHDEKIRQYNAQAAQEIFASNNPRSSSSTRQLTRCDLHGLHIEEALQYAQNHLVNCRSAAVEKTMLIVGRGAHSQGGGARIKPAILQMMEGTGGVIASVHEKNEGCIVVEFIKGK
ncbi:hypothetical protein EW145_g7221 [Phellinidium pouzarii]|uniref:Smr domain-containing protein n=1 Tax=Phellinidium pouzarii TaxID=167371 RepID=A0A4V3XAW1_9AGAM|nr:hypothetical protein EW145_g7221 [Phellinidium pouzarii]